MAFTPFHRGGSGTPLVALHGFTDTWRTWELVLPALEREHELLAPAGGWAEGDDSYLATLDHFTTMKALLEQVAPHADAIAATPEGRRQALALVAERTEHVPAELVAHIIRGAAACDAVEPLIELARAGGWPLDLSRIACPLRIVWGREDKILSWPTAAARYREQLPQADWVELDGVGHCPQLDVPLETAQLILGFTR